MVRLSEIREYYRETCVSSPNVGGPGGMQLKNQVNPIPNTLFRNDAAGPKVSDYY